MVVGKSGLEQDQAAFTVCLPYPVLPCAQLSVPYTTMGSLFSQPTARCYYTRPFLILLGSQQSDEMRITVLFISVMFCLEGLMIPPNRHFTSRQKVIHIAVPVLTCELANNKS